MAEKQRGWYTAFYYLAEHIRMLTNGEINHKQTYSYIGEQAQYINHENPTIRKRTAAALSRIIHSSKYAEEMRERHAKDPTVFAVAADTICNAIRTTSGISSDELYSYLRDIAWPDVRLGLQNERDEGRKELDIARMTNEVDTVLRHDLDSLSHIGSMMPSTSIERETVDLSFAKLGVTPPRYSESFLTIMLFLMAYGHLDSDLMREIVDKAPTASFERIEENIPDAVEKVCLVRLGDIRSYSISGIWEIDPDHDWTIGRYTDCSIIENDPAVSRVHCKIYREGNSWMISDEGSTNGTCIISQDGTVLYDSTATGAAPAFPLSSGNRILLTDRSCYWFGAFDGAPGIA